MILGGNGRKYDIFTASNSGGCHFHYEISYQDDLIIMQ